MIPNVFPSGSMKYANHPTPGTAILGKATLPPGSLDGTRHGSISLCV